MLPGQRVGHYEIRGPLGAGGMGVVYRAHDARIGRDVALKVLPVEFRADPQRLRRFEREAQVAGALSHPNVLVVFDVGVHDGAPYLVTELVEGRTLRQVLATGAVTPKEAIAIGIQLADGLEAAHRKGIVHRDLKPENLMLTADARLKILDFGIARVPSAGEKPLTQDGAMVGTPGYMAPEQARGLPTDARTDLFTTGVILYELLVGRPAFIGNSPIELAYASVTQAAPDPTGEGVSPELAAILGRCLAKDPAARYQSAVELRADLEALAQLVVPATSLKPARALRGTSQEPPTSFVGRASELAALTALMQRPDVRLITLTGVGGVGKTRLVQQLLDAARTDFPDGAWFVPLAPVSDAAAVVPAIVTALGVSEGPGQTPLQAAASFLGLGQQLLVLDNFEHVPAAAQRVSELLAAVPALKVVVTSRVLLRLSGEHDFQVPPLQVPSRGEALTPGRALALESVSLFVQRAEAAHRGFALTADNLAAVIDICVRLDGLPLALELAAARARVMSAGTIASRLAAQGGPLQLLTTGPKDRPDRQQTLRATIAWSHALLDPAARRLFEHLSVFKGGFTFERAGELGGDGEVADGLATLLDNSLIRRVEAGTVDRYLMLETLREFGLEQLGASGELHAVREAHAACFARLCERLGQDCEDFVRPEAGQQFGAEFENVAAALGFAREAGRADLVVRLCVSAAKFWEFGGHMVAGREWTERALPLAVPDSREAAQLLAAAGEFAVRQGDVAHGAAWLERALAGFERLGDLRGQAAALQGLVAAAMAVSDDPRAARCCQRCLALCTELKSRVGMGRALADVGLLRMQQADSAGAMDACLAALKYFEDAGDEVSVGRTFSLLGECARQSGALDAAVGWYEKGIALGEKIGHPFTVAICAGNLSGVVLAGNQPALAQRCAHQAMAFFRSVGFRLHMGFGLFDFAQLALKTGRPARALTLFGAAEAEQERTAARIQSADRPDFDRVASECRARLTEPGMAEAYARGRVLSLNAAVALALSE